MRARKEAQASLSPTSAEVAAVMDADHTDSTPSPTFTHDSPQEIHTRYSGEKIFYSRPARCLTNITNGKQFVNLSTRKQIHPNPNDQQHMLSPVGEFKHKDEIVNLELVDLEDEVMSPAADNQCSEITPEEFLMQSLREMSSSQNAEEQIPTEDSRRNYNLFMRSLKGPDTPIPTEAMKPLIPRPPESSKGDVSTGTHLRSRRRFKPYTGSENHIILMPGGQTKPASQQPLCYASTSQVRVSSASLTQEVFDTYRMSIAKVEDAKAITMASATSSFHKEQSEISAPIPPRQLHRWSPKSQEVPKGDKETPYVQQKHYKHGIHAEFPREKNNIQNCKPAKLKSTSDDMYPKESKAHERKRLPQPTTRLIPTLRRERAANHFKKGHEYVLNETVILNPPCPSSIPHLPPAPGVCSVVQNKGREHNNAYGDKGHPTHMPPLRASLLPPRAQVKYTIYILVGINMFKRYTLTFLYVAG